MRTSIRDRLTPFSRLPVLGIAVLLALAAVAAAGSSVSASRDVGVAYGIVTVAADIEEATEILGRTPPRPQFLPQGLTPSEMSMDPPEKPFGTRFVHQSFAIAGRNVARLDAVKGASSGLQVEPGAQVRQLGERTVRVRSTQLQDGSTNVSYAWEENGLILRFKINLIRGLTSELADKIVASID